MVDSVPCEKVYPSYLEDQVTSIIGPYVDWIYCANLLVPPPSTPPPSTPPPSTPPPYAPVSIDVHITLSKERWTYVSFNVFPTDPSLSSVLGNDPSVVKRIITQGGAAEYISGLGWVGGLAQANIVPNRLYKIFSPSGGTLHINGILPETIQYNFNVGWTWIGVPLSTDSMPLSNFLVGTWQSNDRIISSSEYGGAFTFDGVTWNGPLQDIRRGVGYIVYRANGGNVLYTTN